MNDNNDFQGLKMNEYFFDQIYLSAGICDAQWLSAVLYVLAHVEVMDGEFNLSRQLGSC